MHRDYSMSKTVKEYVKPAHVPDELFIPGNIWRDMGDRPHDRLKDVVKDRQIVFLENHHSPGHSPQGTWFVGSAELARRVLSDPETFSSKDMTSFGRLLGGGLTFFPVDVDPPMHARYRALVSKYFMPASVTKLSSVIREQINLLLDSLIPKGECDFVEEFAKVLPTAIFLDLMGLPKDRAKDFLDWASVTLSAPTAEERVDAMRKIRDYLAGEIEECKASPRDDIISQLATGEIEGRPLELGEALGGAMILYIGGLDTIASMLGWIFKHLAEDLDLQRELRADTSKLPKANEEFLRYYSNVTVSRRATRDVKIGGATIKKGDTITCPMTMPARDETEHVEANRLDISKRRRRHMAFGFGPHTCVGLHLARLEINAATDLWLSRAPEFRINPGVRPKSHGGTVIALDSLPLTW